MKVFALVVCRNEADRYLDSVLAHTKTWADFIHFYDNCSTDNSVEIALKHGCIVTVRREQDPGFMDHEGRFRENAWKCFEDKLQPRFMDWCVAIDCDEVLVSDRGETRLAIELAAKKAESLQAVGIVLPIPEVFDATFSEKGVVSNPRHRVDGYWGTIAGPRLFKWLPKGEFPSKPMSSGSEPTYVAKGKLSRENSGLHLVHLGYAHPDDQKIKAELWGSQPNAHANSHVQSILQKPQLESLEIPLPQMRRGIS